MTKPLFLKPQSRGSCELPLAQHGFFLYGGGAAHLASPQINVTVPSSKSSTVTATSSELL